MQSSTGIAIVTRCLRKIGYLQATEIPTGPDSADAFTSLTRMIDRWELRPGLMFASQRTTKTLASGTATYEIGQGAAINVARPLHILSASLVTDTGATTPTEIPVEVITDPADWARERQKTLSGAHVQAIFYDRSLSFGAGIVSVHPVPNIGTTQLVLYTGVPVQQFADMATEYQFSGGYLDAIELNLCVRLGPEFHVPVEQGIKDDAKIAKDEIVLSNFSLSEMQFDIALSRGGGRGDIRTNR